MTMNESLKPRIFIADGEGPTDLFGWRRDAAFRLADLYEVVDPAVSPIGRSVSLTLDELLRCRVMLVNGSTPSWAAGMVVAHAFVSTITVVAFGAGDPPSPWLSYHAYYVVDDLEAAIAVCRNIVEPI